MAIPIIPNTIKVHLGSPDSPAQNVTIGFADYIYQKLKFKKDMRMSKQEVKDEYKQQEGDPQVKGKIKQKMRESSMRDQAYTGVPTRSGNTSQYFKNF